MIRSKKLPRLRDNIFDVKMHLFETHSKASTSLHFLKILLNILLNDAYLPITNIAASYNRFHVPRRIMVDTISDPSYPSSYVNDSVQGTEIVSQRSISTVVCMPTNDPTLNDSDKNNNGVVIKIHRLIDRSTNIHKLHAVKMTRRLMMTRI